MNLELLCVEFWVLDNGCLFFQIRLDQKQVRQNHGPIAPIPVDNVRARVDQPEPMDVCTNSESGQDDVQIDPPEPEKPPPEKSVSLVVENF